MLTFKSIHFKLTEGFAPLPVYRFTIEHSGKVSFFGKANVNKFGSYTWTIAERELQQLQEALDKVDYFNLRKNESNKIMSCCATCITKVELKDGSAREIEHYLQDDDEWPRALSRFESQLERIVGVYKYITDRTVYLHELVKKNRVERRYRVTDVATVSRSGEKH